MDRRFLATVGAAALLLVVGAGAGVLVAGTGVFQDQPRVDPGVASFFAADATCGPPDENLTVVKQADARNSFVGLRGNVSVPDASSRLNYSFRREGLANYTLALVPVATDGAVRPCDNGTAVVRFAATVQLPHARDEPYRLAVRRGSETVAIVRNGPQSAPSTGVVTPANRTATPPG